MDLAEQVLAGDRLALARLLTLIENEDAAGLKALSVLYPRAGKAHRIGITGPPGAGKSTLVNRLAQELRGKTMQTPETKVAIVAVDPSSPFTGGAILGDRIRMRDLAGDPGVFIRSMATRGALGGLAKATTDLVEALDAAGYQRILIETVGAGQAEVEVARAAHTTIVVDAPGMGDDVQAIKAGILEVADIIVINKADLPGAENARRALRAALDLAGPSRAADRHHARGASPAPIEEEATQGWRTPILLTVATRGEGVDELAQAIDQHRTYLSTSGEPTLRERERLRADLRSLLGQSLAERFLEKAPDSRFEATVERVLARQIGPREAIRSLIEGER